MRRELSLARRFSFLLLFLLPLVALGQDPDPKRNHIGDEIKAFRKMAEELRQQLGRDLRLPENANELVLRLERDLPNLKKAGKELAELRPGSIEALFEAQRRAIAAVRRVAADQRAVRDALTGIGNEPKALLVAKAALDKAEADLGLKAKAAEACGKAKCSADTMRAVNRDLREANAAFEKAHQDHEALWQAFVDAALLKQLDGHQKAALDAARRTAREARQKAETARRNFQNLSEQVAQAIGNGVMEAPQAQAILKQASQERDQAIAETLAAELIYQDLRNQAIARTVPRDTVTALIRLDGQLETLLHGTPEQAGLQSTYGRLSEELTRRLREERVDPADR